MASGSQIDESGTRDDQIPLSSEVAPSHPGSSLECISAGSGPLDRDDGPLQKWRHWWLRNKHLSCITISSDSSEGSSDDDSDDDSDYFDESDVIFVVARCRVMRVVTKLSDIYDGVKAVYKKRYGNLVDGFASPVPELPDRERAGVANDSRYEQILLLNSIDILQSKISSVRRLFLAYKVKMPSPKSASPSSPVPATAMADLPCTVQIAASEVTIRADDRAPNALEENESSNGFLAALRINTLSTVCTMLFDMFKPNTLKKEETMLSRKTSKQKFIEPDASNIQHFDGLQACLDNSWKVLKLYNSFTISVVERSVNWPTFFANTYQSSNTSLPSKIYTKSPSQKLLQYQEVLIYFRNTALFCAYMFKRLRTMEQELNTAIKHFGEMKDKRVQNCKPLSDREELLRRVMMKGEVVVEMTQIASTSCSADECRGKRFMMKELLRIERKVECLVQRVICWRRSRLLPAPRFSNVPPGLSLGKSRTPTCQKKAVPPPEGKLYYRLSPSGGLIIRRFVTWGYSESLVKRAFSEESTDRGLHSHSYHLSRDLS